MNLTYFGHACFLVESRATKILFDPFIRPNPLASAVDITSIRADLILITHGHVDHVADAVELARQTGATVVAGFEVGEWLVAQGVENVRHMNHGGSCTFGDVRVKMVNAVHSSTLPGGIPGGHPSGFVVTTAEGTFYYSGDTALTMDMQLIAAEFNVKFAVLPIGDTFTMGAADAVRAAVFTGAPTVVGVHYDTFPPIKISHDAAKSVFATAGRTLLLPAIGETVAL